MSTYPTTTLLFGAGNFQRAFAAWMMQRLNATDHPVGPALVARVTDGGRYGALERADWRYPVWTRGLRGGERVDEATWVEAVAGAVYPYEGFDGFLATARTESLHTLISNTTEAGIAFVAEELPAGRPAQTFPGKLAQWLHARWEHAAGHPEWGVDVWPCELIEDNGQRLRACVERYAEAWGYEPLFKTWLMHCGWLDTLVDRIVPGRPPASELAGGAVAEEVRAAADVAVVAEPYHRLAIAGASARFRENWRFGAAGLNVSYIDDLTPDRALKVRLLNGAHTAMVPVGLRGGLATVREFVEDGRWGPWLRGLLLEEIAPTLWRSGAPGLDRATVEAYALAVLERFANPYVEHRLEAILLNAFAKWPPRLGATVAHYVASGAEVPARLREAWDAQLSLARERGPAGMPDDAARVRAHLRDARSIEAAFASA